MGWPQNAYIGQKVICVNMDGVTNFIHLQYPLKINKIYKIDNIECDPKRGSLYFMVHPYDGLPNTYWLASQFRPVQSTEKGMKILRGLLNPANHKKELDLETARALTEAGYMEVSEYIKFKESLTP